ncbi:glycosylated lysosomal membrane protein isoform X2 [Carcharodon carcharias]|uniref:glycosylated lysosomal membrane protein isoform X2 n=1 Tax=Carcharodon carcharias TaxID=13397 RepID=UPI001B7E8A39|nr:glycosylated lysosomal membrane protein isoform X2 [Carcharodon carcharias]
MAVSVTLLLCCSCFATLCPGVTWGGSYRRQVFFEYNPGRNSSEINPSAAAPNILHVRAVGANDTIHYLWGTLGAPSVFMVYTSSPNSSLHINWTRLGLQDPSTAVRIEPASAVVYYTAIIFSRVFEYNDMMDTADMSQVPASSFYPPYQLEDFTWDNVNATLNRSQLTAQLRGRNATGHLFGNGSFTFRIAAFEGSGRDSTLPRLLHTANSTKLEFVIEGIEPRGNQSRFALELIVLEAKGVQRELSLCRTIDDEYTPTIFQMDELVALLGNESGTGSFLQWKPVAYTSSQASLANSVPARHYSLRLGRNQSLPASSVAYAFFGAGLPGGTRVAVMNVSFGGPGGDSYNSSRYISCEVMLVMPQPRAECMGDGRWTC